MLTLWPGLRQPNQEKVLILAQTSPIQPQFLAATDIIDWQQPDVFSLAQQLAEGLETPQQIVRRCFEWVRDEIYHSYDHRLNPVTCTASEVLQARTGFCYAKSHLLAALLRANAIPAGLCYQRLSLDEEDQSFCLHGLNALYLPDIGWYRVDARGNKAGIDAQFNPPTERLAFRPEGQGEADLPEIWSEPLPGVVTALRSYRTYEALAENLPDLVLLPGWRHLA